MSLALEDLGMTKEELQERVVQKLADDFVFTGDGEESPIYLKLEKLMRDNIAQQLDAAVAKLADKYVMPNIIAHLEQLTLQQTTQWGERKGEKLTFIEYLTKAAQNYMAEKVDFKGKAKSDGEYNWSGTQTRITYLVHQHLHYSIETAMKAALQDANSQIAKGIAEACKIKLAEITAKLKVGVSTGS